MAKITLPEDNEQILAARYQMYLPTEEELRTELARERARGRAGAAARRGGGPGAGRPGLASRPRARSRDRPGHVITTVMSKALVKRSGSGSGSGIVPAVCSAFIPGVGQLVNGETDKAIGVFAVAAVAGASFIGAIPILGSIAGLVYGATWLYGVADGYIQGKKK